MRILVALILTLSASAYANEANDVAKLIEANRARLKLEDAHAEARLKMLKAFGTSQYDKYDAELTALTNELIELNNKINKMQGDLLREND